MTWNTAPILWQVLPSLYDSVLIKSTFTFTSTARLTLAQMASLPITEKHQEFVYGACVVFRLLFPSVSHLNWNCCLTLNRVRTTCYFLCLVPNAFYINHGEWLTCYYVSILLGLRLRHIVGSRQGRTDWIGSQANMWFQRKTSAKGR